MLRRAWNWLYESYYVRVIRRALRDSLFFVNLKVETGVYSALTLGFGVLAYWIIAGQEAVEQRLTVVISGLIGVGCAFGFVFVINLVMAPVRMERELKAKAEMWLAQLNTQIRRSEKLAEATESAATTAHARESIQPLSDEAQQLLLEAADDPNGSVDLVPTKTAFDIQTNRKSFGNREDPREQARWKAALDELLGRGFLDHGHGLDFNVTDSGYNMADTLTEEDK